MRRGNHKTGWIVLVGFLLLASPGLAQEEQPNVREELEALRRGQEELQNQIKLMQEIEELKKGQAEIRKELADIKRLLEQGQRAPAPAAAAGVDVRDKIFDVGANPVMGESTAKLTLVEFTDYQ